jgi:hypothetical protein
MPHTSPARSSLFRVPVQRELLLHGLLGRGRVPCVSLPLVPLDSSSALLHKTQTAQRILSRSRWHTSLYHRRLPVAHGFDRTVGLICVLPFCNRKRTRPLPSQGASCGQCHRGTEMVTNGPRLRVCLARRVDAHVHMLAPWLLHVERAPPIPRRLGRVAIRRPHTRRVGLVFGYETWPLFSIQSIC